MEMNHNTTKLRHPRAIGWSATAIAFVLGYLLWLTPREWENGSFIFVGVLLVTICALNCYLGAKTKSFDLFLAAALSLLAPGIVIFVAFGFFFSGPTS